MTIMTSVTESGIGGSAVDLDLPGDISGRINFSSPVTSIFKLTEWMTGIPTSEIVKDTEIPLVGGSIGKGV